MSELKAYEVYPVVGDNRKIVGSALHDDTEISLYRAQVYLKSEADKVIAEKDKKIDLYHRGWEESDRINASIYAELRHQKYKRCFLMVQYYTREVRSTKNYMSRCGGGYDSYVNARIKRLEKRLAKWSELMRKFKEAK